MASTPRSITYPVGSDSGDIAAHLATLATTADSAITTAVPTGFKNVLINGNFDVWQRGSTLATVTSTQTFNADRWLIESGPNTTTPTRVQFTQAEYEAMKKPAYTYGLQIVTTQSNAATDKAILLQKIEDVRTLAGEQVTLSFWAKAASGTPKIVAESWWYYGAGGSPSTADSSNALGTATINTTLTRYSMTFTMPSMTLKTFGTDGNSYNSIQLWFSAGTDFNTRTGSMGRQTNTFTITDIQLERGPVATGFDHRSRQQELDLCQRYYYSVGGETTYQQVGIGTSLTTTSVALSVPFPVTMRIKPTPGYSAVGDWRLWTGGGAVPATSIATYSGAESSKTGSVLLGATGPLGAYQPHCVQANNTTAARLTFSAEL